MELIPAKQNEPLACHMQVVDLVALDGVVIHSSSKLVPFFALSYAWGEGAFTVPLLCNRVPLLISQHLANALIRIRKHYRHEDDGGWLWVDAICINQLDISERAAQVEVMLTVFQKARHVLAWIGAPVRDENEKQIDEESLFEQFDKLAPGMKNSRCVIDGTQYGEEEDSFETTCFMLDILKQPWFNRTWVRQEVFAARRLMILYGDGLVDFDNFAVFVDVFKNVNLPRSETDHAALAQFDRLRNSQIYKMKQVVRMIALKQQHTITSFWTRILVSGTWWECSDPRDKVYGALGIIKNLTLDAYIDLDNPSVGPVLEVNYDKEVVEVYGDVVKSLIIADQTCEILALAYERELPDFKDYSFKDASWISNWTTNSSQNFALPYRARYHSKRSAAKLTKPHETDPKSSLRLRGEVIGNVQPVSDWQENLPVHLHQDTSWQTVDYLGEIPDHGLPHHRLMEFDDWLSDDIRYAYTTILARDGDVVVWLDNGCWPFLLRGATSNDGSNVKSWYIFLGPVLLLDDDMNLTALRDLRLSFPYRGEEGEENEDDKDDLQHFVLI